MCVCVCMCFVCVTLVCFCIYFKMDLFSRNIQASSSIDPFNNYYNVSSFIDIFVIIFRFILLIIIMIWLYCWNSFFFSNKIKKINYCRSFISLKFKSRKKRNSINNFGMISFSEAIFGRLNVLFFMFLLLSFFYFQ